MPGPSHIDLRGAHSHKARGLTDDCVRAPPHASGLDWASIAGAKDRTRSAPRRPAAVPAKIPATATKEANASVDNPVSPCPIEQPKAVAPPAPISAAPPAERSIWRGEA